jgi:diguanylate cyclase (GGDEF)-like protein
MNSKLSLLYVEDEEAVRIQLGSFLKRFVSEVYLASDGQEGLELYRKYLPDIVVSDIKMPRMSGIEMVKAIRAINPIQYIIYTTAHSESGFFLEAIDMHVEAYILKPIDLQKLESKLEEIKENIKYKQYYQNHQKELMRKAYVDTLTKVKNRNSFVEAFRDEIVKHNKQKTPLSLIMFDIDRFKNVNDVHGHLIGDEVLIELAGLVEKNTRATDVFARWGGEEFVKVLPNTKLKEARALAQSLRELIEKHVFVNDLKLTCSFGVAEFLQGDTQESVMKKADEALYRAKNNGRNRVEI